MPVVTQKTVTKEVRLSLISQRKGLFVLPESNYVQLLWLVWLLCEVLFSAVEQFLHFVCRIVIYMVLATGRENCLFPPHHDGVPLARSVQGRLLLPPTPCLVDARGFWPSRLMLFLLL